MRKAIILLLISFALLSFVEGSFVFDRRLLNTTKSRVMRRDFTGSIRYGSFIYKGICPSGTSTGLTDISIKVAAIGSSCFTDSSTGTVDTIGYICQPHMGSGKIHFGYPGSNGFVIGGTNFGGIGTKDIISGGTTYKWGSVGQPTYTGDATTSCSTGCTANYCSTSCEVSCTASITASSATCEDVTGNGATFYFVPDDTSSGDITNCGGSGSCCTKFAYPTT
eukprot:TRINITY_DN15410_c0_g1_i1.p1 TRINITY_DN15410_c0_g1~~TRINITY_DN15410_c0_g1_i1.p1  ORF type:complete len:222 (+),score=46.56 TRINITY_DN15410_c0_g1_i1:3-668(+)